jgi:hypothetical protein
MPKLMCQRKTEAISRHILVHEEQWRQSFGAEAQAIKQCSSKTAENDDAASLFDNLDNV